MAGQQHEVSRRQVPMRWHQVSIRGQKTTQQLALPAIRCTALLSPWQVVTERICQARLSGGAVAAAGSKF